MKRTLLSLGLILALVAYVHFIGISYAGECEQLKDAASELIANAQSCSSNDECIFLRFACPFPCITAMNQRGRDEIVTAINNYNRHCMMICPDCDEPTPSHIACINNRCVPQYSGV